MPPKITIWWALPTLRQASNTIHEKSDPGVTLESFAACKFFNCEKARIANFELV